MHTPGEKKNYGSLKSWVRYWDPRAKTVAILLFILGVISLEHPLLLLIALTGTVLVMLLVGLSLTFLLSRLSLLIPFLVLMSLPLILGGGLPIDVERSMLAARITLKAMTSMSAMIILLSTQPLQEFLDGLADLRVPPLIVTLIYLTYRYIFLLMEEFKNMQRALRSRLFLPGVNQKALRVYGEISGSMFVKSLDRSEQVYRAMVSRSFSGRLPTIGKPLIGSNDLIKSAVWVGALLLLLVVDWWWY